MAERFIKFIPSEKADYIAIHHPNAFILLYFIAKRARRENDGFDGLQVGDAIVSDHKNLGLTRKEYRNALAFLKEQGIIESVYNTMTSSSLKVKKRAIKRATRTEIVNLCNSDIWDINGNSKGQIKGQKRASRGPLTKNDKNEEEEKEKVKKENLSEKKIEPIEELIALRENIKLKPEYIEKLKTLHSPEKLEAILDKLDAWMTRKEGSFTPLWCYGQLKPGAWPSNEYEKDNNASVKVKNSSVSPWELKEKESREFAQNVLKAYTCQSCEIEITHAGICFIPLVGQSHPTTVLFKDNGFKDQVEGMLRKRGFTLKVQPIPKQAVN